MRAVSIDSGSHKQATEQKGEESGGVAGCVEKRRALLLSADFTVCPGSPEKRGPPRGSVYHPLLFPDTTTQQPGSV